MVNNMKETISLEEFLKNNRKVCIYGVGYYAHAILRILKKKHVVIEAFIVSDDKKIVAKYEEGIPVFTFTEWKKRKRGAVVIGVSMPAQKVILDKLLQNGVNNIYCVSDLDFKCKSIGIMDTRVAAENHGNDIIMDSVNKELRELFPEHFQFRLPFIDELNGYALEYAMRSDLIFVGGTNALCSHMENEPNFGITKRNCEQLENKIVLAGVGWYKYQDDPDEYTMELLKKVLSKQYIHSVRDNYTKEKLQKIGIENVINTGCLTTWKLNQNLCNRIPISKGKDAILMFTPGRWSEDKKIADIVNKNYDKVYCWPQGPTDENYIVSMCEGVVPIPPNLDALDEFLLNNRSVDYIGTRLHGGIRCLQRGKRAVIFSIDNRAIEMGRDIKLPVYKDEDMDKLTDIIHQQINIKINIPIDKIKQWKKQFCMYT